MGGWNYKGKREAGNRLSIFWLKKHGYLEGGSCSGGIRWTNGYGHENSIGFSVSGENLGTPQERKHLNLQYTHTNRESDEKEDVNYRVELVTTYCHYGGKRYWFICPLTKNGYYCGRRVGTLYNLGKYFGCRHCGNLTYATRNAGGHYKGFVSAVDIEEAEKKVKRQYYNGKPTRKYQRVLKLNERFDDAFLMMAAKLDKRFSRFARLKK